MALFSRSGRFRRSFGQAWTTLDPNWCPAGPLAGLAELQNGCKSQSCGQALTNLSTQSTSVDLHGQLNLKICSVWPCSWHHFLRFCDQIGWHGFGQPGGSSSPHIGQTVQNWTGQLGVANRMCKDAFDWPTTCRAGDGPGLNSSWRPDVNRLAIQAQMAQRPRHQCQGFLPSLAVVSKPLQHHCRQELFCSQRVSRTWASQAGPRHTHQRCQGCQNPPHHH